MTSAQAWYRFIGVRSTEAATVRLFFLHNFFLGIGTILIYVAANVILLENHPQTSLPIAYVCAALAMMVVGRVYTYFEHHLLLKRLAVRVLLAVVVMTFILGLFVLWGHSVASAVAIMVGYRMIYLLTNLEFWGVSAVVFDVRQGKRLFSIISSGDMPAKALGALLSVLVHAHADLILLLLTAFGAFGAAMYVVRQTIRLHVVDVAPTKARLHRRPPPPLVQQLFGGSELVFTMCLSLAAIACVVTSVEYFFFVNVKEKFHHQEDLMQFIGIILILTYLSALLFKLVLSWKTFERIGIRWSLAVLPLAGLLSIVVFGILLELGVSETGLLVYFCGLYLLLEVLRRSVFDPIFLVLFQPLTPHTRLKGHTLVKGFYEPMGMALAGALLIGLHYVPTLPYWIPFLWMALFMVVAIYFLNKTYRHYLDTLKGALERRFLGSDDLLLPVAARKVIINNLQSPYPADVLNAIDWLQEHEPATLVAQSALLLQHADKVIRERTINTVGQQVDLLVLHTVATTDSDPQLRKKAARLLVQHPKISSHQLAELGQQPDVYSRTGSIQGRLTANPANPEARVQLADLLATDDTTHRIEALDLLPFMTQPEQQKLVEAALRSSDRGLQEAGIRAAGKAADAQLTPQLIGLLTKPKSGRVAVQSLANGGSAIIPFLRAAVQPSANPLLIQRIAGVCEQIATPESRQLLVELAEQPNLFWRAAAIRSLRRFAPDAADSGRFQTLLDDEWQLALRLITGIDSESDPYLAACLAYELTLLQQRVFGILMQLYDPQLIADAQRGVSHAARDRKANALEMLDNLIPQPVYRSLQALVDELPVAEKVRLLTKLTAPLTDAEPIRIYVVQQGERAFTDWTISVALRQIVPDGQLTRYLDNYLQSTNPLIQESALAALQQLDPPKADRYKVSTGHASTTMTHSQTAQISVIDRIVALKRTALFADTPENVLSSVAQIMNEVTYHEGQEIFAKGETGTSLFIIYDGEVGIYDGSEQLATFLKGGFFGELALLDAEPRSATAIALTDASTFRIDQDDFYDLMEERGEVLQNIVRALCQRLRRQNEVLRDLSASV
ncbi:cyclic nucleotide-binding domain-containing protein [Spirosoma agri]|uniref:Cyclic nucleotide-binding domain-containing protein n=1 Tax=Spirosoma agri TaxID=1987381 RepID=A0A6M0IKX5_9BACT|nr:cyclic nucleotide-binding domain-containing protein [Spirosoma agri]NEU68031.1 cyclic nucleotide-binding domain-containing protein [Spirosoma agri]